MCRHVTTELYIDSDEIIQNYSVFRQGTHFKDAHYLNSFAIFPNATYMYYVENAGRHECLVLLSSALADCTVFIYSSIEHVSRRT